MAGWAGLLLWPLQRAGRTHTTSQCSSAGDRSFGRHRRELLAAGSVLSLQSQQGQRRCGLVHPAQRTGDLILCPHMPLVIKQLLLLTQGNMFFMVSGYRTKKKNVIASSSALFSSMFQMQQLLSRCYLFQSKRKQRTANIPSFLSMKGSLSENNISGRHVKYLYPKVSPLLSNG